MKVNHECTDDIYKCQLNHVLKENKLWQSAFGALSHHFQMLNDRKVQKSDAYICTYTVRDKKK